MHIRASMCIDALEMARDQGLLHPDGAIYHTDRGTQFTSRQFQAWCAGNGITQSMGKVGVCWDNAVAENFSRTSQPWFATSRAFPAGGKQASGSWNTSRPGTTASAPTAALAIEHRSSRSGECQTLEPDLLAEKPTTRI